MTCTQCSGSHGRAASGVPWGQDLPLTTATAFVRGLLLKKTEQPGPPQCHGEVGHSASRLSGQRKGRAAGCSEAEADQHLGPHVSALEPPPSSPGTCGARCAAPPFSLSVLPCFSAAKLGPLALSSSAWGRGRVPAAPCLGPPAWEQWTPSAFHRALFPTWFSQGQIGSALAWNNLQDAGGGGTSLPTSSLGTGIAPLPPSLPRSCGQEGRSVTTCEGNRGLFFRAQGLASLGSAADGCSPHHPSPYPQHSP